MVNDQDQQPDPLEKSLGDQATGADVSRTDEERSLGDQSTTGDALSSISDLSALSADFDDEIPLVDLRKKYDIQQSIGKGGMGEVWLAVHKQLDRSDAIKRISPKSAGSRKAVQRFLTEAKALVRLRHSNIVQIYDFGRDADGPFIIMEFVEGGSLLDKLKTGPLHLEEAIDLTCQLCDALSIAHKAGIIHRDIKPANILLTEDGVPKLTDFGLARNAATEKPITKTGTVVGTVHYMSPEQRRDATKTDERSDIWSLAATTYQLITGHVQVIDLEVIPANLRRALSQALKPHPDERFSTSEEFKVALQKVLSVLKSTPEVQFETGVCLVCNTTNAVNRKFCGNPDCIAPLQATCLTCSEKIPVWDIVCGECGAKQPELVAQRQTQLQERQQQAESLRREYKYQEAQEILRPLLELDDVRFYADKDKVTEMSAAIEIEHQEQISQCNTIVEQAQLALADCQFASSIRLLEGIAEPLRDESTVQLLQRSQSKLQERDQLRAEIKEQAAVKNLNGLLIKVRRLLDLAPNHSAATKLGRQLYQHLLNCMDRGLAYHSKGELDKAIADYTEVIRIDPDYANAYRKRGDAYSLKGEYDKAIADYTEVIRIDPDYANAYRKRGNAYRVKGEYDKAIADYTEVIRIDPDFDDADYYFRGTAYLSKKEYDKAIADYTEVIRIDPDFDDAYIERSDAYNFKGEYDKAIADGTEAIRINPTLGGGYYTRGTAYLSKKEYDKAIADYTEVIRIDPDFDDAYIERGDAYTLKEEYDKAIADYTEAIRIDSDYALAYNNRGYSYVTIHEYEKAITDCSKAIELKPTNPEFYDSRGVACAGLGEHEKALVDYNKAIELGTDSGEIYHNRGLTHAELGNQQKAAVDLAKAKELGYDP